MQRTTSEKRREDYSDPNDDAYDWVFEKSLEEVGIATSTLREPEGNYASGGGMAERLQERAFELAKDTVLLFREHAPARYDPAFAMICKQAIRSATSTGANYRAVRRARNDKEFYAKLCIVVEECDETIYWLALALQTDLGLDKLKARTLLAEAKELCKIFSKSRATLRKRLKVT